MPRASPALWLAAMLATTLAAHAAVTSARPTALPELDNVLLVMIGGAGRTPWVNVAEDTWLPLFRHRLYATDTDDVRDLRPSLVPDTVNLFPPG